MDWSSLAYLIAGVFFGIFFLKYLTAPPLKSDRYLFLTTALGIIITFSLLLSKSLSLFLWHLVVTILSSLFGYAIQTHHVLSKTEARNLPRLNPPKQTIEHTPHTAILYFTHGEPEMYNPIGWIQQFREFDHQKIPFIPKFVRPFFLYSLRRHYLQVGTSHHRQMHKLMMSQLEALYLPPKSPPVKFYLSFLDDSPHPDEMAIHAVNSGATQIVLLEVFLTDSNHTKEGENSLQALHLDSYHIPLYYTRPLWDSELLHHVFVEKAEAARGETPKDQCGLLLVGHGQPDEWDQEFPTETHQELEFRIAIKHKLVNAGYCEENIQFAWMEFKTPRPADVIQQLAGRGLQKILYFAAAISADAIHSQYDIPKLVEQNSISDSYCICRPHFKRSCPYGFPYSGSTHVSNALFQKLQFTATPYKSEPVSFLSVHKWC